MLIVAFIMAIAAVTAISIQFSTMNRLSGLASILSAVLLILILGKTVEGLTIALTIAAVIAWYLVEQPLGRRYY